MRLKRETTCLTAMRQAMDAGDFSTALARATELAALDPGYDDVRLLLEDQVRAARPPQQSKPVGTRATKVGPSVAAIQTTDVARVAAPGHRHRPARLFVAAMLVVLAAAAGWAIANAWSSGQLEEWTGLIWPSAPRPDAAAAPAQAVATQIDGPPAEPEIPNLPPIGEPERAPNPPAAATPSAGNTEGEGVGTGAVKEKTSSQSGNIVVAPSNEGARTRDAGREKTTNQGTTPPAVGQRASAATSGTTDPTALRGKNPASSIDDAAVRRTVPPPPGPPASQAPWNTPAAEKQPPIDKPAPPPQSLASSTTASGAVPVQRVPVLPEPDRTAAAATTDSTAGAGAAGTQTATAVPTYGTHLPSPTATSGELDEERAIRGALTTYQQGYTTLDAAVVRSVWPRVNAQALRSAFGQLESQRIAFAGCSIDVRGMHAAAICRGTATYVPKVGSGEAVSMQRTWEFALRKFGDSWLIDAATSR